MKKFLTTVLLAMSLTGTASAIDCNPEWEVPVCNFVEIYPGLGGFWSCYCDDKYKLNSEDKVRTTLLGTKKKVENGPIIFLIEKNKQQKTITPELTTTLNVN